MPQLGNNFQMGYMLKHTGAGGETIEIYVSDATDAKIRDLMNAGDLSDIGLSRILSLLARSPHLGKQIAEKKGASDPLLATIELIVELRKLDELPVMKRLRDRIPDQKTVDGALAYLEAEGGNYVVLGSRLLDGTATTFYDQAAIARIFQRSQRSIDGILPKILPRSNKRRAEILGRAFGCSTLSPAELSRAMAAHRQPKKRQRSWKTVYGYWQVATTYRRQRRKMSAQQARNVLERVPVYRHLGYDGTKKAIETGRKLEGVSSDQAAKLTKLRVYLEYRRTLNPHIP